MVEQMRSSIYGAIKPNVDDGGSTNKCKKNIVSIIITSILNSLTD